MENPTPLQNVSPSIENEELHEHTITPKKSQKLVVALFIIFVVGVVAAIAYYFGTKKPDQMVPPTEPTPAPSSAPVPTKVSDWKTFGDSYLSIQVPPDFQEASGNAPLDGPSPILSLSSKKAEYFAPNYNQESILVISRIIDTASCLKPADTNLQSKGETMINGNTFNLFTSEDAGAGNRYYTTIYRILNEGSCTEIAQTVHTSSDWTNIDMAAVDASVASAQNVFEQMIETFRFVTPPTSETTN